MWQAAVLAVEDANRRGGPEDLPFRLVARWSENPWAGGAGSVTRLAYDDRVWAVAGAPDGAASHLVEQVIAQARLPFVSAVSTDQTTNLVNVPWIFSCAPGDHLWAPVLARAIRLEAGEGNIVVLARTDHDSRISAKAVLAALDSVGAYPGHRIDLTAGDTDFTEELSILNQADAAVAVVVAGPADAARLVADLRRQGLDIPVFGDPRLGQRLFVTSAGEDAEGVRFPLLWSSESGGEAGRAFAARFYERCGVRPDYTAAYSYDALTLLTTAIRRAGFNRARIRDALRKLSGFSGVTGTINWDPTGQNTRPVLLGTIRHGRIVPDLEQAG
jgi:branched-chain amino acid transport system substrate-binding protein